jgi:hypothetical protein
MLGLVFARLKTSQGHFCSELVPNRKRNLAANMNITKKKSVIELKMMKRRPSPDTDKAGAVPPPTLTKTMKKSSPRTTEKDFDRLALAPVTYHEEQEKTCCSASGDAIRSRSRETTTRFCCLPM